MRGYVHLKNIVPRPIIKKLNKKAFEVLCELGVPLKLDGSHVKLCGPPPRLDYELMAKYAAMLRGTREYRAVQTSEKLERTLGKYLGSGWKFYYPRQSRWARISFPDRILPQTEPHQDGVYLGGGKNLYSVWIPLHDCSRQLGGLGLMPKTHKLGPLAHKVRALPYPNFGPKWKSFSYQAGDVMLFHYDIVHGGSPNRTRDGIRLSIDFRVQQKSK